MNNNSIFIIRKRIDATKLGIGFFVLFVFVVGLTDRNHYSFYIIPIYLLVSGMICFFASSRKLIFNEKGLQYHNFWRIKWADVKSYTLKNHALSIKTDGKERIINKIKTDDLESIRLIFEEKLMPENEHCFQLS